MKYILFVILACIGYQFIFNIVIPVYKATRKIKKGFQQMQAQSFRATQNGQQHSAQTSAAKPAKNSTDYIDFEEVK